MDTGDLVVINVSADLGCGILVHVPADLHIAAASVFRLFLNPGRFPFQERCQRFGNGRRVGSGLFQFPGIQVNVFHTDRGCQQVHVAVVDIAPVRRHGSGAGLVPQGKICVFFIVHDHQIVEPPEDGRKSRDPQQSHHQ